MPVGIVRAERKTKNMQVIKRKAAVPIPASAFEESRDTVVYWLSGAGFLVHSRSTNILIDPVLMKKEEKNPEEGTPAISEIGLPLKTEIPLDMSEIPNNCQVLYTHADGDHMGPMTAKALAAKKITMTGTLAVFERLVRQGIPQEQIEVLRVWETKQIGDVLVESMPADHPWQLKDLARGGRPYRMGDCCGFILNTPDGRIYCPGDTRLMEEHLRIPPVDLLALDVSTCEYHLNHTSAVVLANHFLQADLIPFHYGTYDAPQIAAHCGEPEEVYDKIIGGNERGFIPAPGEAFLLRRKI